MLSPARGRYVLDPLTATAAALELAVARAHNVMARKADECLRANVSEQKGQMFQKLDILW